MSFRAIDALTQRLLRSLIPGYVGDTLAQRIQRAAFTLTMLLVGVLGVGLLVLSLVNLRAATLNADVLTLQALRGDLVNQLDGIASEMRFLSQSPLVWTAISDSAGRDAYLRPYLRSQSGLNRMTRLTLLDYRGRLIAAGPDVLNPESDADLRLPLRKAQQHGKPAGHVDANGKRLILAFPVVFPYGQAVIGVLLGVVPLDRLVQARAGSLGESHGLALLQARKELLVFPGTGGKRYLSATLPLTSSEVEGLYAFDLELFERQPVWLISALPVIGVYMVIAALLIWFAWTASHRLAVGLAQRLERLADSVQRGGDPETLPEDPADDEIGLLSRVLKDSLKANHALTATLEERVVQRSSALAASEAQYRFLTENIKDVVWMLDIESLRFLYVSPSVKTLMGYTPEELEGALLDVVLLPQWAGSLKDLILERAAAFRSGEEAADRYYLNQVEQPRKGGGSIWSEVSTCYRIDERSGHVILLGVTRDISQRRRAEELERYAAFQSGVAEMSVSVLHNIGNAITAVTADAEDLCKASADLARVAELLELHANEGTAGLVSGESVREVVNRDVVERQIKIEREAAAVIRRLHEDGLKARGQRIADSVRHIADIVRIQQNAVLPDTHITSFDLAAVIQDVLALNEDTLRQYAIETELNFAYDLPLLTLPRNQFQQALMHVMRNACKAIQLRPAAMPDEKPGRIEIRAERLDAERVRISVSDNGIGLASEQLEAVFHPDSAGLSLHATAVFAQEVGGSVRLESQGPGQGARLVLDLPHTMQPVRADVARAGRMLA
jgi:PAS domain S-box-containing protein